MTESGGPEQTDTPQDPAGGFATTHWSVVLAASEGSSDTTAFGALSQLCRTYWRPLYAFLRRRGHSPHDAEDLVQDFFGTILATNPLRSVSPDKGRFRSFILKSLQNFAAKAHRHQDALRRGGQAKLIPLPALEAEESLDPLLSGEQPAERVFDRVWAQTVMQNAGRRLREEYAKEGRATIYEAISPWLAGEPAPGAYAAAAARLGLAPATIPVEVHRLRKRLGDLLRHEVAQTVAAPDELAAEFRYLLELMMST